MLMEEKRSVILRLNASNAEKYALIVLGRVNPILAVINK